MAAVTPDQLFPGIQSVSAGGSVAADSLVIPFTALPGLLAAEADPATGDGREVARILTEAIASKYVALAEKPAHMAVTLPNLTTLSATRVRKGVNFAFDIDVPSTDLQMPDEA